MAGFAGDRHLGHRGVIGIGGRVIILADARIMARGTHRVPGHSPAGPMAPFAGMAIFVAVDVEPLVVVGVVGDFECLKTAACSFDQELTKGIDADDTQNLLRGLRAAAIVGDHLGRLIHKQGFGSSRAMMECARWIESGSIFREINGSLGKAVMGCGPAIEFALVTRAAGIGASVHRKDGRVWKRWAVLRL